MFENRCRGENCYNAKLTLTLVSEIREKYFSGDYTCAMLAKEYGLKSQASVSGIVRNIWWKNETLSEEYFKVISEIAKNHLSAKKKRELNV